MFHYCLSRTSNPFKVPQCPICKVCYPSTSQTLTNPANPPSPPNPTRHHLKNPAAHPLAPHHHPTRSTIQSTQPLPLHLARNSQHPQLKSTYPAPQKHPKTKHCHHLKNHSSSHPTIYTSPSFCSTSFTSNRLHSLTLHTNPYSHQLLHQLHTRLHPALNTFPSLTSNCHLHLLLCPNFTPRFRPFYLTSTHKHTTRKPPIKPP